ncbi:hypothetical protein COCSUDRAFT_66555 [Coccomyxa subellipsoidea C-169]|uniref:Uncharacterized protein n=1 Tax=Coccomyxa subellipsoidea (strain C-169) TaxID=574566 RepID=I0YV85_COCSC|nr:hypothetical protein COCSUDRAFT_66555 [Coccomyxa subellipsoidea C-169]EIE22304.1 hypothetical protein COCSUDRAFT_66555 [Coccomyxa subellipsoidea C-169]|eukprot:XP_005646848.1 hypothetical protein COCSUDRAFT_66555 [Coccomyxa subellipsoidea C-169]
MAAIAAAEALAPGKRLKPAAQGKGVKRGCMATFTVRILAANPQVAEIRYYCVDHVNHGDAAEGPGRHHTNNHISAGLRQLVQTQLRLQVPASRIVQQNKDEILQRYMVDEGIPASDKEAALERLLASLPPRDYFLNVGDVNNIAATLQTAWKRHPDQQKSVELYVQHMGADVLLHQRQAPLPGTPDAAHFAAMAASRPPGAAPQPSVAPQPGPAPQPSVAPRAGTAPQPSVAHRAGPATQLTGPAPQPPGPAPQPTVPAPQPPGTAPQPSVASRAGPAPQPSVVCDADPTDNSLKRKRDILDPKRTAQQSYRSVKRPQAQRAEAGDAPSFLRPQPGRQKTSVNAELSSAAEAEVVEKRRAAETAAQHASAASPGRVAQPVAATAAENAPCVHPLASAAAGNPANQIPPALSSQRATRERRPPTSHRDYAS